MSKVYLLGAGPGDPGLLTLRAKEILEKADVVVYDALANASFLDFARPDAERIYVGKIADQHAMKTSTGCSWKKRRKARMWPASRVEILTSSAVEARRLRNFWPRASNSRRCRASLRPSPLPPTRASR
jgi:siroheme synthase